VVDQRTDAELLAAHVAGDPQAFNTLIGRHRDRLWSVALRTTSDPEEAADALQDALISAFRRADQFRGDAAVTTWLHRIVVNASLDRLRRKAVRATTPLPDGDADTMSAPQIRLADPRDHLAEREIQLAVTEALAELPEDQRLAVVLVDIEGWSIDEAAAYLDCPAGTVKSRCFRGRAKLAERLEFLRNPDTPESVTTRPATGPEGGDLRP
jgi:RNA polymerase sigma-70 factor (ECF subfamily)